MATQTTVTGSQGLRGAAVGLRDSPVASGVGVEVIEEGVELGRVRLDHIGEERVVRDVRDAVREASDKIAHGVKSSEVVL